MVAIFDASGRLITKQSQFVPQGSNLMQLDLGTCSNGLYTLMVETEDGVSYSKFVK
jgi:hypothetical protein